MSAATASHKPTSSKTDIDRADRIHRCCFPSRALGMALMYVTTFDMVGHARLTSSGLSSGQCILGCDQNAS